VKQLLTALKKSVHDYYVLKESRQWKDWLVLRREEEDGPVVSGLTPVWSVHLHHLLDPET